MKKQLTHLIKFSLIITFVFTFLFTPLHEASAFERVPTAGVAINGEMVDGINPIKLEGEMYLPIIYLSKILSYNDIRFESPTKTYELTDGSTSVRLTMGGSRARRGDDFINIDPPRWIDETGYVTLDAASALFNTYIYFKPENGSIQIEKPASKYEVQSGDTLWRIAQAHHTTVNALKAANDLGSNVIYKGQLLNIPPREETKEIEPIKEKKPVDDRNTAPPGDVRSAIIEEAKKYIGAGYEFGATYAQAPSVFDCSLYIQYVFGKHDIALPRTSREQAGVGEAVDINNLQPGDLLFFTTPSMYSDGRVGHNGIYMGNGDMIHASSSRGVHIAENFMDISYWRDNYLFSKRIID
ncbi:NlpC/P60 family protein [Bacillus shivajii]|uniref:C40 family peptidase n=1 Tax=Bacillus shivajii TaxID=1983719 RepID=UPI001CFA17B7|nr:C40 family peptidase [Bacillus shivajii]UCZ51404.1 NlpC/P60 family protein [Bacillus shivajii]